MKTTTFILMILSLFVLQISYSQDYEKILDQNVVFLYLKDFKNPEIKKLSTNFDTIPEMKHCDYRFYHYYQNKLVSSRFLLLYPIPDKNSKNKKNNPIVFRAHKSFLKKNKEIIIDIDFIKKIGRGKTLNLLRDIKTIFIIDETDEVGKKEILVKEVKLIIRTIK